MKTKHRVNIVTVVVCAAGLGLVQPTTARETTSKQPAASPPAAAKPAVVPAAEPPVKLSPVLVNERKPRSPPVQRKRAPWEIASWDIGQARLVIDATPRGYFSADPRRPEAGQARVDLVQLHW